MPQTPDATESLANQFAALHAERERTWPAAQLQTNISQRNALQSAYDATKHFAVGDALPAFSLKTVEGGQLTQDDIPTNGAVFVFFRFAGCPACNIALPYYQRTLWPSLKAQGITLIAVSPQVPEKLTDIKTRHALDFVVASDTDNRFGNAIGITFEPADKPDTPPAGWIGETTGTGTWTLPQPTVVYADKHGRVAYIDVSPDWLQRPEAEAILNHLPKLRSAA